MRSLCPFERLCVPQVGNHCAMYIGMAASAGVESLVVRQLNSSWSDSTFLKPWLLYELSLYANQL